jgi:hypothetical protein
MKKFLSAVFSVLVFLSMGSAQTTEVTVSLNEQFFETLLDSMFKNFNAPEFPLAKNSSRSSVGGGQQSAYLEFVNNPEPSGVVKKLTSRKQSLTNAFCDQMIRLLREGSGIKTAIHFREGKIFAPIAFTGSYNPPLIGCIDFAGLAETNIDIEFDQRNQKLLGRVRVLDVQLNGTGGIGGSFLSKIVQNSIDKKINPIEILPMNKLSFVIPLENSGGSLKMNATGIRPEISNGVLNIHVTYQFSKAN